MIMSNGPRSIWMDPRSTTNHIPAIVKVVPVALGSAPISVKVLKFPIVVCGPEPSPAEELKGYDVLVGHLHFHFNEMVWRPAIDVVAKNAVHGLEDEEFELREVPAEDQLGHLALVVLELQERSESCMAQCGYRLQEAREVLGKQSEIGVTVMGEQPPFAGPTEQ